MFILPKILEFFFNGESSDDDAEKRKNIVALMKKLSRIYLTDGFYRFIDVIYDKPPPLPRIHQKKTDSQVTIFAQVHISF